MVRDIEPPRFERLLFFWAWMSDSSQLTGPTKKIASSFYRQLRFFPDFYSLINQKVLETLIL